MTQLFNQESYWQTIERRHPKQKLEQSWKCLCCRDTGIVDTRLLQQYYSDRNSEPSSAGVRCERKGCWEGSKYPSYALETMGSEICGWLHDRAVEMLQAEAPDRRAVIEQIGQVRIKTMPTADESERYNDPILKSDPDSKYFDPEVDF